MWLRPVLARGFGYSLFVLPSLVLFFSLELWLALLVSLAPLLSPDGFEDVLVSFLPEVDDFARLSVT